jgi:hypothetical protein
MPLDLYFPPLSGGKVQGLNDSGIETFEGEFQKHIVRECGQNAADARRDGEQQVTLKIRLHSTPSAEIPALNALRDAVTSARQFWSEDAKTGEFCRKALSWTSDNQVEVLEVADFGTTGLEGTDEERRGSWFGLVLSEGVSNKRGDAGGAFGIGKDAPFAGSFIRTVLYSTLNQSGGHAFQGVAKLTTHIDRGQETQQDGFIGLADRNAMKCRAVRQPGQIPPAFRREEVGTSLFILAYRNIGGEDWTDGYIRQAVENFWPAIHRGTLVFQIGDRRVDTSTLPALMSRYSGIPEFISRYYYRAVANENRFEQTRVLPHLGACRLYLVAGDATYPKKVCMTRQTGMVIFEASRFKSYRPFAGLFVCESTEGNAYLRQLEPPKHHKWDATRGENESEAKAVLKSIRDWINECLRHLNPDTQATEAEVPELNRYLPDDEDEPLAEQAQNVNQRGGNERLVTAPLSQPLVIQEVPPRPPIHGRVNNSQTPADGNEAGEGVGDGQPTPQNQETETPGGQSTTTGGGATGNDAPHGVRTSLKTRSVQIAPGTYRLILRSAVTCSGKLGFVSVGEDNKEDKDIRVVRVTDLATNQDRSVDAFALEAGQTVRLEVKIESTVPISLRAYCHGN